MHEIRQSLRGEGVVPMGKNTMVRRALKGFITENPEYERLLPHVKGNIGFVRQSAKTRRMAIVLISYADLHQRRPEGHP